MTLQELKDKADTKLTQLWTIMLAKQENYLKNNSRFWQGILTPSTMPVDGEDLDPDLSQKPSYQLEDWNHLELPANTQIPFQIRVDQYKTPKGSYGFQATVFVKTLDGDIYSRSKGYEAYLVIDEDGNRSVVEKTDGETLYRDYNWTKIDAE